MLNKYTGGIAVILCTKFAITFANKRRLDYTPSNTIDYTPSNTIDYTPSNTIDYTKIHSLEKYTVKMLRQLASIHHVKGYNKMTKAELITILVNKL